MKRSFGYFQNDGAEFVVTEPDTQRALVNYSWNPSFIAVISQHGGGDGIYKERALQYIDVRGRAMLVRDGQRYFYLRDEFGDIWSPGWHPVQAPVEPCYRIQVWHEDQMVELAGPAALFVYAADLSGEEEADRPRAGGGHLFIDRRLNVGV